MWEVFGTFRVFKTNTSLAAQGALAHKNAKTGAHPCSCSLPLGFNMAGWDFFFWGGGGQKKFF